MENQFMRRGEPEVDHLDEFELLDDDVLNDRENPYAEWVANNILEEDGQPVEDIRRAAQEAGIDVDDAMDQFRRSSSSEYRQRQLNRYDPISDNDSTSTKGGDDNDRDDSDNNGSSDDGGVGAGNRNEESIRPMSPFTGEDHFTHATQDQDHGSRPTREYLSYSRRKKHSEGSSSMRQREHDLASEFSSMDVSSGSGHHYGYGHPYGYTYELPQYDESSTSSGSYGYGSYASHRHSYDQHIHPSYPCPLPHTSSTVTYTYMPLPRLGFLQYVTHEVYDNYVREYMQMWQNTMTWAQYCAQLEDYHLRRYQSGYMDPHRASSFY